MKNYLMIDTRRDGYAPSQVDDYTMTVADLIDYLAEFDDDAKVIFRNDGGYTYGTVTQDCFKEKSVYDEED